MKPDPWPWVCAHGWRCQERPGDCEPTFDPRSGYSQNREDYR